LSGNKKCGKGRFSPRQNEKFGYPYRKLVIKLYQIMMLEVSDFSNKIINYVQEAGGPLKVNSSLDTSPSP